MNASVASPRPHPAPSSSATGRRNPWRHRFTRPYTILSVVVVVFAVLLAVHRPWGIDFWVHATAVDRLEHNLLRPGGLQVADPMMDSSYYSPYTVLLAFAAQLTGAGPIAVLSAMAPLSAALLCVGFHRFCRVLSGGRWFPVLAAGVVVTMWGFSTWAWSGFLNLYSLPVTLPLPSTVATGLMLLIWALVAEALVAPRLWSWPAVAGLATLVVLIHPLTAAATVVGSVALVVWRRPPPHRLRAPVVAAVAVVALALTWPYYSILDLAGSPAGDAVHEVLYRQPWWYEGLIVVALPALWLRYRRDNRDCLVWIVLLCAGVWAVADLTGDHAFVRLLPTAMLAAQLALAVELYALRPWRTRPARAWLAATLVIGAVAAGLTSGNLLYALPPTDGVVALQERLGHNPRPPDHRWLRSVTSYGDVVITDDSTTRRVITAQGLYTVSPGWPDPVAGVTTLRAADEAQFFTVATTTSRRRQILAKWDVDWILVVSPTTVMDTGTILGAPVATGPHGERLYAAHQPT